MTSCGLIVILSLFAFLVASATAKEIATYKISKIVDGGLLTEEGQVISLYGLQFPDPAINPVESKRAFDRLRDLALPNKVKLDATLFREISADVNRYGDWHGKVMDPSGKWIQRELVEKGLVWWSGAANYPVQLRASLVLAERRAEEARSGMWQTFSPENANTLTSLPRFTDFAIAEGQVLNVYSSSKMTYINFGENWKTDFTAAISSKNKRKFESQGWKLSALIHKLVRIRGSVRWYNGPFMELSFPEQLDIRARLSK